MSSNEIIALIIGVLVAEGTEIAPWLAKRLVRWSAHLRYPDPERADLRAEELEAVIDSRPGKLFKLITALVFTTHAGATWSLRALTSVRSPSRKGRSSSGPRTNAPIDDQAKEQTVPAVLDKLAKINRNLLNTGDIDTVWFSALPPAETIHQRAGRVNRNHTDRLGP